MIFSVSGGGSEQNVLSRPWKKHLRMFFPGPGKTFGMLRANVFSRARKIHFVHSRGPGKKHLAWYAQMFFPRPGKFILITPASRSIQNQASRLQKVTRKSFDSHSKVIRKSLDGHSTATRRPPSFGRRVTFD